MNNPINTREVRDQLDRTLNAWAKFHRSKKHMPNIGFRSFFGNLIRSANKDNNTFVDVDLSGYDIELMEWLDGCIEHMEPRRKRILNLEYINWSKDRADIWAREFEMSPRTYYRLLREIRDDMVIMIALRDALTEGCD